MTQQVLDALSTNYHGGFCLSGILLQAKPIFVRPCIMENICIDDLLFSQSPVDAENPIDMHTYITITITHLLSILIPVLFTAFESRKLVWLRVSTASSVILMRCVSK